MTTKGQLKQELKASLEYEMKQSKARVYMRDFVPYTFEGYEMKEFHRVICEKLDLSSFSTVFSFFWAL